MGRGDRQSNRNQRNDHCAFRWGSRGHPFIVDNGSWEKTACWRAPSHDQRTKGQWAAAIWLDPVDKIHLPKVSWIGSFCDVSSL